MQIHLHSNLSKFTRSLQLVYMPIGRDPLQKWIQEALSYYNQSKEGITQWNFDASIVSTKVLVNGINTYSILRRYTEFLVRFSNTMKIWKGAQMQNHEWVHCNREIGPLVCVVKPVILANADPHIEDASLSLCQAI